MYHVAMINRCAECFGVMTTSSFKSREAFDEWYRGEMKDGTDRPLNEVYEFSFGSEDYDKVQQHFNSYLMNNSFYASKHFAKNFTEMEEKLVKVTDYITIDRI